MGCTLCGLRSCQCYSLMPNNLHYLFSTILKSKHLLLCLCCTLYTSVYLFLFVSPSPNLFLSLSLSLSLSRSVFFLSFYLYITHCLVLIPFTYRNFCNHSNNTIYGNILLLCFGLFVSTSPLLPNLFLLHVIVVMFYHYPIINHIVPSIVVTTTTARKYSPRTL